MKMLSHIITSSWIGFAPEFLLETVLDVVELKGK